MSNKYYKISNDHGWEIGLNIIPENFKDPYFARLNFIEKCYNNGDLISVLELPVNDPKLKMSNYCNVDSDPDISYEDYFEGCEANRIILHQVYSLYYIKTYNKLGRY